MRLPVAREGMIAAREGMIETKFSVKLSLHNLNSRLHDNIYKKKERHRSLICAVASAVSVFAAQCILSPSDFAENCVK